MFLNIHLAALVFGHGALAHMLLSYPPSLRYTGNPYTTDADYSLTSPLLADGTDFPCKGYQSLLGTPQGTPVITWEAGQTYNFTVAGGAPHGGGSCQASISCDDGKTFTVIESYIGGCPLVNPAGGSFNFTIPADTPAHPAALFAWTVRILLSQIPCPC